MIIKFTRFTAPISYSMPVRVKQSSTRLLILQSDLTLTIAFATGAKYFSIGQ